jgi:hypothetical protein
MSDNSKLADERIRLCERLIKYSDDIHCIAVHRDLANDLREAEALITLLADDAALRAVPADAAGRSDGKTIGEFYGDPRINDMLLAADDLYAAFCESGKTNGQIEALKLFADASNSFRRTSPPIPPGGQQSAPQLRTSDNHGQKLPNGDTAGCGADTIDVIDELRQTAGNLTNGIIEDGEVPVKMLSEAADEIERLRGQAWKYLQEAGRQARGADTGAQSQAPVAWRWRPKYATNWIYDPEASWLAEHRQDGIEVEPLYAAPSPTAAGREWRPIIGGPGRDVTVAPWDGKPVLIYTDHNWGGEQNRIHRAIWTDAVHGSGIHGWAIEDCKFGPYPLRGYCNVTHWMPLPALTGKPADEKPETD